MLADKDMAAVADHFGVVPENVRWVSFYPAYVLARGFLMDVSVPAIRDQPYWPSTLFPYKSGIERGLRHLSDMPKLRQAYRSHNMPRIDLPLKQKLAPLQKWITGVHQLLLWMGYSRPSQSSFEGKLELNARRR